MTTQGMKTTSVLLDEALYARASAAAEGVGVPLTVALRAFVAELSRAGSLPQYFLDQKTAPPKSRKKYGITAKTDEMEGARRALLRSRVSMTDAITLFLVATEKTQGLPLSFASGAEEISHHYECMSMKE